MSSQAREIRWIKPALDLFLEESQDPEKDMEAVFAVLIYIRDHPDDEEERLLIEKDGHSQLQAIEGEVFVSYDSHWEIYYSWLPAEITIVLVEPIGRKK